MPSYARWWSARAGPRDTHRPYCVHRTSSWEAKYMSELEEDTKSWEDPIVREVRSAREALLAASGYDLGELCRRLREGQQAGGRRVVTLSPRPPEEKGAIA